MVLRKRQRHPCPSCSSQDDTAVAESQQSSCPSSPQFRRRCRRGQQKVTTTPWKMTMATFLLWLCDNSGIRSGSSQQSSSMAHAWGSNSTEVIHTKKGLQTVGSCSKEDFQVEAVYLVCDSPGAYYRGSSTYRDSTTCIYGDKARLQLQFAITDSFTGASSIRLEIESGIYDQWKRVAILDDLCSYAGSNLQRIYNEYDTMTTCPTPGLYQLDTYFTVPAFTTDSELHYTPDVRFRFYNGKGKVLGCATTGTLALGQQARNHAQHGLIALMAALFGLMCLFATLMYLNCGRDRRMLADKHKQKHKLQQSRVGGAATAAARPRPVVTNTQNTTADQDQRYHYFNANEDPALNGSSDFSSTSNAGSSMSSHHPQRKP